MAELSQTAANVVTITGTPKVVTSEDTITAGMPVFKNTTGKYKRSKADVLGTALCDGIALNAASNGQPLMLLPTNGVVNLGATLVVGETYVVSDATAGKIRPLADLGAGDFTVVLGFALTTANFKIDIAFSGVARV